MKFVFFFFNKVRLFPRLLWSWFLVALFDSGDRKFSIAESNALKLVQNQFCSALYPHPWFMNYGYLARKLLKAKKLWINVSKHQRRVLDFVKCSSRKWFQERNNFCSILTHWMSSFFPLWRHCQQCPWQKRNIDRSLKWVPSSSSWESPAELPDSQTRAPSTIKTGRRIESFFLLLAGLRGCSLPKLTQVLSWEI